MPLWRRPGNRCESRADIGVGGRGEIERSAAVGEAYMDRAAFMSNPDVRGILDAFASSVADCIHEEFFQYKVQVEFCLC